jgi:hypothetical protein
VPTRQNTLGWMSVGRPACHHSPASRWYVLFCRERACVAGAWITYLPGTLQVPLSLMIAGDIVSAAVGLSLPNGGVQSVHPRGIILGPFSQRLPSMCVVLSFVACHSCFQHFGSQVLNEMLGGMIGVAPYCRRLYIGDRRWWWHWLWRYRAQAGLHRASLATRCPVPASLGAPLRICPILPTLHPHPSTRGGWRAKQSWHVHRSPPRSSCSTRHCLRSTATFFIQSMSF